MNIVILRSANECKIVIMYAGILHHTTGTLQQEHYTNNPSGLGRALPRWDPRPTTSEAPPRGLISY